MMQYKVTLNHDGGTVRIITAARNREQAIGQVCDDEGAPHSALVSCVPYVTGHPKVTTGAVYVPEPLSRRYRVHRPIERRDYPDGVVVVTVANTADRWYSIVWDRAVGTRGGFIIRENKSSADVSALVRKWRQTAPYELHRTSNPNH